MESYYLKGVEFQFAMTRMFWMWIVVMDIRNSMNILVHRKMVELVNFFLRIFYHTQKHFQNIVGCTYTYV